MVVLLATVVACSSPPDDQQRIERRIAAMIEALESGGISNFMAPVADDFTGANGRLDRRSLGLHARRERISRTEISIQRLGTEIELVGSDRARATIRALATGGSGLIPDEGRVWRIQTGWRLDDEWMLISADWEPVI